MNFAVGTNTAPAALLVLFFMGKALPSLGGYNFHFSFFKMVLNKK